MECSICFEHEKKIIKCFSCNTYTCYECSKTFLLTNTNEAHCSKCNVGWNIKFLITNLPKTWVIGNAKKSYRTHRKAVMLDREKSQIHRSLATIETKKPYYDAVKLKNELTPMVSDLRNKLREYKDMLQSCYQVINRYQNKGTPVSKVAFFCPCPVNECKGMIKNKTKKCVLCDIIVCTKCLDIKLDIHKCEAKKILKSTRCPDEKCKGVIKTKTGKCELCDIIICTKCSAIKPKNHECEDEKVETAKLILKSTKACPKCGTRIFKVDGCDQMWCTECNTPFSWKSGVIETGTIHNPHAIAWFNQNKDEKGRDRLLRGVRCGGLTGFYDVWGPLNNILNLKKDHAEWNCKGCHHCTINYVHRSIAETEDLIRRYTVDESKLDELRENYLLGNIDEVSWRRNIFLTERRQARKRANSGILETYQTLGTDHFNKFCEDIRKTRKNGINIIESFLNKMVEIRKFINKAFMDELQLLGTQKPLQIEENWRWNKN